MKNIRKVLCLVLLSGGFVTGSQAFGILPPLYNSLNEYKVLLSSPELTEKLTSADLIMDIQRNEGGFLITTSKNTLQVDLVYEPQKMPGPARYHLNFHDAIPH